MPTDLSVGAVTCGVATGVIANSSPICGEVLRPTRGRRPPTTMAVSVGLLAFFIVRHWNASLGSRANNRQAAEGS